MLQIRDLKKSFVDPTGQRLPVLDVSAFDVAAGEQVVLVGRSGCGKTTLLHTIAGISRPDSGTVTVDGVNLFGLSEAQRDRFRALRIGYVFQTFNLLKQFTALENVLLAMSFHGKKVDRKRACDLLASVGLAARLDHRPTQLSVGEQQRVAVARALANQPALILADEPTANVDARNQQQIIDLLRERCAADRVALILVTHTPEVAGQFSRVENLESLNRAVSAPFAAASSQVPV